MKGKLNVNVTKLPKGNLHKEHNEGGHMTKEHKTLKPEWEPQLESEVTMKENVWSRDHQKHTTSK